MPDVNQIQGENKLVSLTTKRKDCTIKGFIYTLLISLIFTTASFGQDSLDQQTAIQLINSTVRVRTTTPRRGQGSGVVVHTRMSDDPRVRQTFIVTNRHVVQNSATVQIDRFIYLKDRVTIGTTTYQATVAHVSSQHDLALIRLDTPPTENFSPVTIMTRREWDRNIRLYARLYLVSCGQGVQPHVTNGNLSSVNAAETDMEFTAPIIFGSSGGGIYNHEGKLVGICNRIRVARMHGGHHPVPHLAMGIPLPAVISAFNNTPYSFIFEEEEEEEEEEDDWGEDSAPWEDWEEFFRPMPERNPPRLPDKLPNKALQKRWY